MSFTLSVVSKSDQWRRYRFSVPHGPNGLFTEVGEFQLVFKPQSVDLWAFEIYPEYRRRGYSKQMLAAAISHAAQNRYADCSVMWLAVKFDNVLAQKLYLSHGFKTVRAYKNGQDYEMERPL